MIFLNVWALSLLALFYFVFIGRTILLALRGINPFALGKGKSGFRRVVELFFFAGLLYWTWEVIDAAAGLKVALLSGLFYRSVFNHIYLKGLGCLLLLGGFILFSGALFSFGASWRIGIDHHRPGELVTSGIFAVSRNPIFLALDFYFLGMALIYGTPVFILTFLLTVVGIHYQILQEERFLKERYREKYREYRRTVRRYL